MEKKIYRLFITCLLVIVVSDIVIACSDSDEGIRNLVGSTINGKWKLVRQGSVDTDNGVYLEFNNTFVKYETGVGTDNYSSIESQLQLEDDWSVSSGNVISGHILFTVWGKGTNRDEINRFLCWVEKDDMFLLPDEGQVFVMDPTMFFKRIK
ncbi:MAG: hypothetical protein IJT98_06645 [Prevotella sp.]|nr:hypothetical protein [Prevotella sp.]